MKLKEDSKTDKKKLENEKEIKELKSIKKSFKLYYDYDVNHLVDFIVNWYEMKYPERDFDRIEGINDFDFNNLDCISENMDFNQLLYRLPYNYLDIINLKYEGNGFHYHIRTNEKNKVLTKKETFVRIYKKAEIDSDIYCCKPPYFILNADYISGVVNREYEVDKYIDNDGDITLEEVLAIFEEKYSDILDFSELKKCVNKHKEKSKLRDEILQLIALKLLYSKNTTPQRGYQRALKFINEFNKELNVNISTKQIDDIMDRSHYESDNEVVRRTLHRKINEN